MKFNLKCLFFGHKYYEIRLSEPTPSIGTKGSVFWTYEVGDIFCERCLKTEPLMTKLNMITHKLIKDQNQH